MKTEKPILSIDYGSKRVGLAVSDSKGVVASPLKVLTVTEKRTMSFIVGDIKDICQEYGIKTILIGKPQTFEPTHEQTERKIKKFVDLVEKHIDIPIIRYDESYSTTIAQNLLQSLGQSSKSYRHKIDMIAATVFLQEFLNSEKDTDEK